MTLSSAATGLAIDLDNTAVTPGIAQPVDPAGLAKLAAATTARIAVGAPVRGPGRRPCCASRPITPSRRMLCTATSTRRCWTASTSSRCRPRHRWKAGIPLRPDLGRRLSDAAARPWLTAARSAPTFRSASAMA